MRVASVRALVTGGAGGIGRAIAAELLRAGAAVLLAGRDEVALRSAARELSRYDGRIATFAADITHASQAERMCRFARQWQGGINALINSAGTCPFGLFDERPAEEIDAAFAVNAVAPMRLCHELLPHLRAQPAAHIVNIGSVYGAIGFPAYAVYSATKFALRGFTEALSRELAHTAVRVQYLAPRATRTPMNASAVERMNAELGARMDPPERVGRAVRAMIERDRPTGVVGWPEKLFVRINGLLPRIVDRSIRKQLPVIRRCTRDVPFAETELPSPPATHRASVRSTK